MKKKQANRSKAVKYGPHIVEKLKDMNGLSKGQIAASLGVAKITINELDITCKSHTTLPLSRLIWFQGNLAEASKDSKDRLEKALRQHGIFKAFDVWDDGKQMNIVDGHARKLVLEERFGYTDELVPVNFVLAKNLKDAKAKVLLSRSQSNKTTEDGLFDFIHDLDWADISSVIELPGINLDKFEVDFLLKKEEETDVQELIDRAEELNKKWEVKSGDLWQVGDHRLLCGDATNAADVQYLLNGIIPNLMVTDPPYGVSYDPNWRNEAAKKGILSSAARRIGKVTNDDRIDWSDAYKLFPGNVAYTWSPGGDHVIQTGLALQASGFQIRNQIMWRKSHFPISRGHYTYQHEPCWYGVRKGMKSEWIGDKNSSTVWDIALDKNVDGGHSTQKPIECMARAIRNHNGDVYEPFLGSGTTLIACQQLQRKCYAMEIHPSYCAVSLQRWQVFTGESPERI